MFFLIALHNPAEVRGGMGALACISHDIELMNNDHAFSSAVHKSAQDFLSIDGLYSRYCSAPPSYRSYLEHSQKRHDKIYFQFIKEHYQLFVETYADLLNSNPEIKDFFDGILKIDQIAKEMFNKALDSIAEQHPEIKQAMLGQHQEPTVITKIVRYEKSAKWGTTPHFDKSGLSLIWDSDDENNDSLLVCQNTEQPNLDDLKKPERQFSGKDGVSSTILIAGSCFQKVGIDLKPTLHGVAPITKDYRHAVISFGLIPDINTSDLQTDFVM